MENKAKTMVVLSPVATLRVRKTKLLVISGPLQGQEFLITKDVFSMGSGMHNDLQLEDGAISKRHCEITINEEGYRIQDLDSTNGTHVQGIRVTQAYLNPGAELTLGKTRLIFCPMQESQEIPVSTQESFGSVLGKSLAMRRVFHLAETYSASDASVMLTGETGTGKEILAEEIHRHSPRKHKPFIVIDCAALAKELIESELFGHTKGSFTGATGDRAGAFEHADGGTVFLDEVGDLSPDLQPKLLRVLEKREIRRVGSNDIRKINVRIICATNRKMDVEVNEGRFREDLFYRLSVVPIELPPLRRRREDIPMLVRKFITQLHGAEAVKELVDFDATMDVLKRHEWPGNVRELRNLVDLAFYSAKRPVDLSSFLSMGQFMRRESEKEMPFPVSADRPFKDVKNELITEFEKKYLQDLLLRNGGNVSKSAREAGIERAYLQRLIKKYDL
jgi:transcriptional regulator with GAF, ATPase, and Fis domain